MFGSNDVGLMRLKNDEGWRKKRGKNGGEGRVYKGTLGPRHLFTLTVGEGIEEDGFVDMSR